MSIIEVFFCDTCAAINQEYFPDDGLPSGWAVNVDGEHFCADCLKRNPLDPPEADDE